MSRTKRRRTWPLVAFVAAASVLFVWFVWTDSRNEIPPVAASDATTSSVQTTTTTLVPDTTVPDTTVPDTTVPDTTVPDGPAVRDAMMWPYPWDSIWNYPIGDRADLIPLEMVIPRKRTLSVEEDIIVIAPDAPKRDVVRHDGAWKDGVTRCGSRTGEILASGVPIPLGWQTDPGYTGSKPNHSAAILMPDMTLFETQPLHICQDGVVVSQFTNDSWQGDSILTGGMGAPDGGAHGGSGMSAFGGTIRLGEWVPGGEIRHVIKIEVYSRENLSRLDGGFRWPASRADGGYSNRSTGYGGSVEAAKMGALLALRPDFDIESLRSEPAAILAKTLRRYGAYVVDGTGRSTVAFAVEWGPNGRVKDEFEQAWGFPMAGDRRDADGAQREFLEDMEAIYRELHVVDDNTPSSKGGAGERLAPWAPPFADGTGGRP